MKYRKENGVGTGAKIGQNRHVNTLVPQMRVAASTQFIIFFMMFIFIIRFFRIRWRLLMDLRSCYVIAVFVALYE